jgi:hypothetical protein
MGLLMKLTDPIVQFCIDSVTARVNEFLKLDKKIDILGFIREGYGVFHLMGDQGILDEIEEYVREAVAGG